ncbi:MAG: hypothetical protein ACD_4C00089G0001, partial [uncultured bacterium (gcode 4)]
MTNKLPQNVFEVRTFAEKFKELRELADLKQGLIANKLYSKSGISMIERGVRLPAMENRKQLVKKIKRLSDLDFDVDLYKTSAEEDLFLLFEKHKAIILSDKNVYNQILIEAEKHNADLLLATLHHSVGKNLYKDEQYRESVRECTIALTYASMNNYKRAYIHKSLADSYHILNELLSAESNLEMALKLNKDESEFRFRCLFLLAKVYENQKDSKRCWATLRKIYKDYDDPIKHEYADMVKAYIMHEDGNIAEAIQFAEEKLKKASDENKAYWLYNLSAFCKNNKDYDKSIIYLKKSIKREDNKSNRIKSFVMLGEVYILTMRVSEARNILISVHDDVIKLGDIYQIL